MAETQLRQAAEGNMDEMMMSQPMRIIDASNMMMSPVSTNDRPYDAIVKRLNNERVEDWYEKVLKNISTGMGTVPAGRVSGCLRYYLRSFDAISYQAHRDRIWRLEPENIAYWAKYGAGPIEKFAELGHSIVYMVRSMILATVERLTLEEQYSAVYSKTTDPLEWDRLANDNPKVMYPKMGPFGPHNKNIDTLLGYAEVILNLRISPQIHVSSEKDKVQMSKLGDIYRVNISKNERPLEAAVMKRNNEFVAEWARLMNKKYSGRNELSIELIQKSMIIYVEGHGLKQHFALLEKGVFPLPVEPIWWVNFISKRSIEELHAFGPLLINQAWGMIMAALRIELAKDKWEIYQTGDLADWLSSADTLIKQPSVDALGLTKESLDDIKLKVSSLINNPIEPKGGRR